LLYYVYLIAGAKSTDILNKQKESVLANYLSTTQV